MYCLVDVLILADVFERFRSVSMEKGRFEVDPAHYVSAPQMAWDAMLKKTGATLDLITDPAMYQMIESGMRGGVCMISQRYAKANNELVGVQSRTTKDLHKRLGRKQSLRVGYVPTPSLGEILLGGS